jgi:hypothetical protein
MNRAMTQLLRLLPLLALVLSRLAAAEDPVIDAVRQADDARVAAMVAADGAKLDAILSDSLHYAHSSGTINDKAAYMASLTSGKTKILSVVFEERTITVAGPGVAIITGKCTIDEIADGKPNKPHLSFLDVWRLENGVWRFLAWQSNRLTP